MADYPLAGEKLDKPYGNAMLRLLIGRKVEYLETRDIDRSGRGYYWPQRGTITAVRNRNVEIDGIKWIYKPNIVQLNLIPKEPDHDHLPV